MLFYILTGLIALTVIWWIIYDFRRARKAYYAWERPGKIYLTFQFLWKPAVGGFAALLAALICMIPASIWHDPYELTSTETYALKALADDETTSGSIFLFVGQFSEDKTISYIREDGSDGLVLREVSAAQSTIYERDESPSMSTYHWETGNQWFTPFAVDRTETYAFTVPDGSVSNDFTVAP